MMNKIEAKFFSLSSILGPIDPDVLIFNGSMVPLQNNRFIVAYRTTVKPLRGFGSHNAPHMPALPYNQMTGFGWAHYDSYMGLAVIEEISDGTFRWVPGNFVKIRHNFDATDKKKWVATYSALYNRSAPDWVVTGPEDPRIYWRDNRLFITYYVRIVSMNKKPGHSRCWPHQNTRCTSMYEVEVNMNWLDENVIYLNDEDRTFVCSKFFDDMNPRMQGTLSDKTMKNWTHIPEINVPNIGKLSVMVDNYNDDIAYYVTDDDFESCKKVSPGSCSTSKMLPQRFNSNITSQAVHCIKSFFDKRIRKDVSVAMTSPTVQVGSYGYGVAHVRVKSRVLESWRNSGSLSNGMNAYHIYMYNTPLPKLGEYYFMMFYEMATDISSNNFKINITRVSPPFLAIPPQYGTVPYDVNFPTGLCFINGHFYVTFGCGDCLFYCQKVASQNFMNKLTVTPNNTKLITPLEFYLWPENSIWKIDDDHFIENICKKLDRFKTTTVDPIFSNFMACNLVLESLREQERQRQRQRFAFANLPNLGFDQRDVNLGYQQDISLGDGFTW